MLKVSLTGELQKSVLFVGLDYHQAFVQVCVMDASGRVLSNHRCANTWQAVREMPFQPCYQRWTTAGIAFEPASGRGELRKLNERFN